MTIVMYTVKLTGLHPYMYVEDRIYIRNYVFELSVSWLVMKSIIYVPKLHYFMEDSG